MIKKLEINGIHVDVDKKLHDHVINKIGKLDKYLSRQVKESVHVEVFLKERKVKTKKDNTCEVVMHLPKDTITIKETNASMFAAVDILEDKLKNLLKKYKETHQGAKLRRRLYAKLRRKSS